ncbi:hypothetical protein PCASD_24991 [Puccinia coronata f. sp. avenae]|uniref:Mediator of RNA polymerase II transcription subunit 12 n=1 Tax=Puccinia coronata f. sp. avenae TaxID=200324 RepID=A0A2N5TJ02_9BASI|nr:hypothetical protein PCASD_24991 [Puccinia coronata f. sp. avenae]
MNSYDTKSTIQVPGRVTLNEQKRQSWLCELADDLVPLLKLSKNVPHGFKGEKLLEMLVSRKIECSRATWYIQLIGLDEINAQRNKNDLSHIQYTLSFTSKPNQSLPNFSLAPVYASEDNRVISHLDAEPNHIHARRLFESLDREIINQLQPVTLESLIQFSANINLFDPDISKVGPIARLELATKAFKILEDRQELTAESYSNLIIFLGFSNKLPQATALFESYKQSPFNPDSQNSTQVQALKNPSSLTLVAPDSLTVQKCQSEPANKDSLMRAPLVARDTFSAVTLLEESLPLTVDSLSTFKSSIKHILKFILGLIRSEDYSSASNFHIQVLCRLLTWFIIPDSRCSTASMLARQLKIRLVACRGTNVPKNCANVVVLIHAIATFQAFNGYLRPRIIKAQDDKRLGRTSGSSTSRLSGMLAAFATVAGLPASSSSSPSTHLEDSGFILLSRTEATESAQPSSLQVTTPEVPLSAHAPRRGYRGKPYRSRNVLSTIKY